MRSAIYFIVLFLASPTLAIDTLQVHSSDPVLTSQRWTQFDQKSGLIGGVFDIFEDQKGRIWFATDQGVQCYDGYNWATYTTKDGLSNNRVTSLTQTRDGVMWFGTDGGGISRFDPSAPDGSAWQTYTTEHGLVSNFMRRWGFYQTQDGTLWAGFQRSTTKNIMGGISRFDGHTWSIVDVPILPNPSIRDIKQTSDGTIWFSVYNRGVLRLKDDAWQHFMPKDGLAGNDVWQILIAQDGTIWFTCQESGICRYDPSAGPGQAAWYTFTTQDGLPENAEFISVLQTPDGTIWTTGNETLCRFDGKQWHSYHAKDLSLFRWDPLARQTGNGTIWFWEWEQEKIFRFDASPAKFTSYTNIPSRTLSRGQSDNTLFAIDNALYLGGREGLIHYDGQTWTKQSAKDGLIDGWITTVLKDHNNTLWVAGQHQGKSAAARYQNNTWQIFTSKDGLIGKAIYTGYVANNGDIWFATRGQTGASSPGILKFDGQTWHTITTDDGLIDNLTYTITQTPDQSLWFGTQKGLSRFAPSRDTQQTAWTTYTPGQGDGATPEKIRTLFVARDNTLWMGYSGQAKGATQYDGKTWTRYTKTDGLDSDNVWQIYQSHDGDLWFGLVRGLSRFNGQTWSTYSPIDLPIPTSRIRSIGEMPNGVLWLREDAGSATVVVRFTPDRNPPQTFIEPTAQQVSAEGNVLIGWYGRDMWDETTPRDMRYQWRLNNSDWATITRQTRHALTSLSDGSYVFEVRAIDRDGNIDPTPSVHTFIVAPPWWKNPWMIGGIALLVGLIIVQTGRVVHRDRRMLETNKILQEKTENLEAGNRQIQEANRLKSQFLANMSHELRTPLNAILGFAQLMTRDTGLTDKQKENLGVIGRSGEHLLGLINDVLDMSKIEAGQIELNEEDFDLHRLLDSLEEMLKLRAENKGLELIFEQTNNIPQYIRADEGKLRQVLINLLGNAIKFTETGSVILHIACTEENNDLHLYFKVQDTGPGIAPEEIAILFDAFVQTRAGQRTSEGTGLGLPISQEHVKLMGGEIHVESEIGQGSTFQFDIPVIQTNDQDVQTQKPKRHVIGLESSNKKYRILVVDDAFENRKLLSEMLQPVGFEVREAENGQEGLDIWKEWNPHLIWMDMRMPVMDGYEATRHIKTDDAETIVIAITASAFEEERSAVLSAGCDDFVRKPVNETDIFDTMAKHLNLNYIYQSTAEISEAPTSLTPDALQTLPTDWLHALNQAASEADTEAVENLISQIEPKQQALADALINLVEDFQFDKLIKLTQVEETKT